MKMSILVPVYNEKNTIKDVLALLEALDVDKEIILVDDFSTDGTRELLRERYPEEAGRVKVIYHEVNRGKGSAIRTAISYASGDYVIVQDADLEYSPSDILSLARLAEKENAEAIYGSRFLSSWRSTSLPHYMVNAFLTGLTNLLFGARLTDMETCYKMIRSDIVKGLDLKAERFEFEPEVTIRLLEKGVDIKEAPVSYRGRGYDEGKKITWKDGFEAVATILRLKFLGKTLK